MGLLLLPLKGETFFVGKDVAKALGYSRPLDALAKHVEKDDSAKCGLIDSMGRKQKTIIINDRDHVETEDKLEERIVTSGQWR